MKPKINSKITNAAQMQAMELDDTNQVFAASKKLIRQTNKEAKHKRKKDQYATLKNASGYIVELQNLSKNFVSGGKQITRVLNDLNLQIKEGEFIVLYGKSGSGKSTLLNIMSGLDRPTHGQVIVANQNLPYLSNRQLTKFRRDNLAFIFQQYYLLNNITGYENAQTGAYLQREKLNHQEQSKQLNDWFAQFELDEVKDKFPSQMSGGQQQRISIIRALSKNANIIFADEPTGALDPQTSLIVMESLKRINQELKKTVIMVSHDRSIAKYASRVITLKKGKIVNDSSQENEKNQSS